jgi:hypothetical protein
MKTCFSGRKDILILMNHEGLFNAMCSALLAKGLYQRKDDFHGPYEMVFMDYAFWKFGSLGPLEHQCHSATMLLFLRQENHAIAETKTKFKIFHDLIMIPRSTRYGLAPFFMDWFDSFEAKHLMENSTLKFGSGLWVSVAKALKRKTLSSPLLSQPLSPS